MIRWLICCWLAMLSLAHARGERADRDKPLNYEADTGECDDLQQVCVLAGNVVLVKGTMRATGDRVQIRKDPEGYQYGLIQAAPGKVATFRQRRDTSQPGVEEFVDGAGRAHRIRREVRHGEADLPGPRAPARKRRAARRAAR